MRVNYYRLYWGVVSMTRLKSIHPYPAMVSDELAVNIAQKYVTSDDFVLDPFCGSGRLLLAAAEKGANFLGTDINPLAVLISRSKIAKPDTKLLMHILSRVKSVNWHKFECDIYDIQPGRKVSWFPDMAIKELSFLIDIINHNNIDNDSLVFLCVVLSATVREVSYCRQRRWKLHRLSELDRKKHNKSALDVFCKRLFKAIEGLSDGGSLNGAGIFELKDARGLRYSLKQKPDMIITSPPYGDSKSTVQYGGMSSLSLGVLHHIKSLDLTYQSSESIDRACLGSVRTKKEFMDFNLKEFWHGGSNNSEYTKVKVFAYEIYELFIDLSHLLKTGGKIIVIVGNRTAGGWRLYLDRLIESSLDMNGLKKIEVSHRTISGKRTPAIINRMARNKINNNTKSIIRTMSEEHVIVFEK